MARATTKKLTAKQQEVLALVKAKRSTAEIAAEMQVSEQAIHGHVSRLRKSGHLPGRRGGRKARPKLSVVPNDGSHAEVPASLVAATGSAEGTVEAVIEAELRQDTERLQEVREQVAVLSEEESQLDDRIGSLNRAKVALGGGVAQASAA